MLSQKQTQLTLPGGDSIFATFNNRMIYLGFVQDGKVVNSFSFSCEVLLECYNTTVSAVLLATYQNKIQLFYATRDKTRSFLAKCDIVEKQPKYHHLVLVMDRPILQLFVQNSNFQHIFVVDSQNFVYFYRNYKPEYQPFVNQSVSFAKNENHLYDIVKPRNEILTIDEEIDTLFCKLSNYSENQTVKLGQNPPINTHKSRNPQFKTADHLLIDYKDVQSQKRTRSQDFSALLFKYQLPESVKSQFFIAAIRNTFLYAFDQKIHIFGVENANFYELKLKSNEQVQKLVIRNDSFVVFTARQIITVHEPTFCHQSDHSTRFLTQQSYGASAPPAKTLLQFPLLFQNNRFVLSQDQCNSLYQFLRLFEFDENLKILRNLNLFKMKIARKVRRFFVLNADQIVVIDVNDLWSVIQGEHLNLTLDQILSAKERERKYGTVADAYGNAKGSVNEDIYNSEIYCPDELRKRREEKLYKEALAKSARALTNQFGRPAGDYNYPDGYFDGVQRAKQELKKLGKKANSAFIYDSYIDENMADKVPFLRTVGQPEALKLQNSYMKRQLESQCYDYYLYKKIGAKK